MSVWLYRGSWLGWKHMSQVSVFQFSLRTFERLRGPTTSRPHSTSFLSANHLLTDRLSRLPSPPLRCRLSSLAFTAATVRVCLRERSTQRRASQKIFIWISRTERKQPGCATCNPTISFISQISRSSGRGLAFSAVSFHTHTGL